MARGDNLGEALNGALERPRRLLHVRRRRQIGLRRLARSGRLQARRHGGDRPLCRLRHRISRPRRPPGIEAPASGSRSRRPSTSGTATPPEAGRSFLRVRFDALASRQTSDADIRPLRSDASRLNAALHTLPAGANDIRFEVLNPARRSCGGGRNRQAGHRRYPRAGRLLLRRHERRRTVIACMAPPARASPRT